MKTLNITKGEKGNDYYVAMPDPVRGQNRITEYMPAVRNGDGREVCVITLSGHKTGENNQKDFAEIAADAFNTANKTGLLPSELTDQNKHYRGLLMESLVQIEYLHKKFGKTGSGENVISRLQTALDEPKEVTTLTRSEADEAMDNGHRVAHDGWSKHASPIFKRNGNIWDDEGPIPFTFGSLMDLSTSEAEETGWRIVKPQDQ